MFILAIYSNQHFALTDGGKILEWWRRRSSQSINPWNGTFGQWHASQIQAFQIKG